MLVTVIESWLAATWLMWPWWAMIPKEDLIDVTLVSDDTFRDEDEDKDEDEDEDEVI